MEELSVGDLVRLKSGGPVMTVSTVGSQLGPNEAYCEWFSKDKLCHGSFVFATLEKVEAV